MTTHAYYNENDPFCAEWLRNLIAAELIALGEIDKRGIVVKRSGRVPLARSSSWQATCGKLGIAPKSFLAISSLPPLAFARAAHGQACGQSRLPVTPHKIGKNGGPSGSGGRNAHSSCLEEPSPVFAPDRLLPSMAVACGIRALISHSEPGGTWPNKSTCSPALASSRCVNRRPGRHDRWQASRQGWPFARDAYSVQSSISDGNETAGVRSNTECRSA
jgi:hypothetical protein